MPASLVAQCPVESASEAGGPLIERVGPFGPVQVAGFGFVPEPEALACPLREHVRIGRDLQPNNLQFVLGERLGQHVETQRLLVGQRLVEEQEMAVGVPS